LPVQIGAHIGAYEIVSPLGAGGMGEVYRARDGKLNRDVALKVLPDSFANDPERLARFQREAQVLASLNHPHIAHIHGIEDADGVRALVMELVEGPTLADVIAGHALGSSTGATDRRNQDPERQRRQAAGVGPRGIPINEALPIAKQIANALEAAHAQGIIHRDLKPANIKVRDDGTVKVLDFGLAKVDGNASASNLSMSPTITSPAMMTGGGVILGTAAYMSPEQAKGKAVDKRTDVWAFGCVFFEMLTGARAFEGEDVSETMASILRAEPDWKLLPVDVPDQIRFLIKHCLEKDRARRLADFSVVQFLMNEVLPAPVPSAIASSSRSLWTRALPVVVTAVIVTALTAGAMGRLRPAVASAVTRFTIAIPDGQVWSSTGYNMMAVSPQGTHIVYAADRRLYHRSLSDLDVRAITGPGLASDSKTNPVFSPDGGSVAYWDQGDQTIKRMALSGGAAVTVCTADAPSGMSWSGDTIFFGQGSKGIMRVSASGGKPESIISVKPDEIAHGPQLLPGGQSLLFTLATGGNADRWNKARIVAESLESQERTTLIDGGSDARYLPTGHLAYALGGVVFAVPFDVKRLALGGSPMPIVEGVRRAAPGGAAQFGISDTGSLAYIPGPVSVATGQLTVGLFDRKGGSELLNIQPGPYQAPRMSPDGKHISFGSDDSKGASIWIYELSARSAVRRLTFEGQGRNRFPIWSADSQRVAFQSDREGDLGIFWQRADGTGTAERLTKAEEGASHIPESWAPDGERFLYSAGKGGMVSLWVFSLRDKQAARFDAIESPASTLTGAVFSPDGRWVSYASRQGRPSSAVYVQPFPPTGAKYQISKDADDGHHPLWSPDGTELWFEPGPGRLLHAVRVTTKPSFAFTDVMPVAQLFRNSAPGSMRPFDISRDGQHFLGLFDAADTRSAALTPQIRVVLNWFEELKQRVPLRD
jgi:serine/threonine protein kinase